ncbi:MAG: class I SAM-dependent methyltransferase [Deltaproteobacteria bacterium]|jgi:hypothetical protein|nr:class I SAM-dependent methyltransferase [Deltaproteobacteria bacterium]
MTVNETDYEKNQRFNFMVSYFHSVRYKNIVIPLKKLEQEFQDRPINIIDIGCAHAKLYQVLNSRFNINYTGIEINPVFVEAANSRYSQNQNFMVIEDSVANVLETLKQADMIVAMESLEHIQEHEVVRIVEAIAAARPKVFICSVPIEIGPSVWLKNIGSFLSGYIRHTEYSWRETFWAGLYQLDRLPPHDIGHKGFDWRWLAQTIRHNMKITSIRKLPFKLLPSAVSFSVFITARPMFCPPPTQMVPERTPHGGDR